MLVFTAVNIPRLSDFSSAAAAGNGGDPLPPNNPVGLWAQCDKEGTGSESTGEFVVVDTTARKRKGNGQPPSWSVAAHNINIESPTRAITISIEVAINTIFTITISAMSVFTAVNIPRLLDFSSAAAAGNGGDPPPPNKPVSLQAQCDKEGTGSKSTGEFVVVNTTARKRKGNGVGKEPVRRSKRARRLPLDDASNRGDSCPKWCRGDNNLPARMQQARCRGCAIWTQSNCTLSGGSRCGACVRAGADKCFVAQTPFPTFNSAVSAPPPACHHWHPASAPQLLLNLIAAMAVLLESTAHALRILNTHQSCHRHENIEFNERRRIEEMGSGGLVGRRRWIGDGG
ncbi:MAG: hypothetical protein FRX48_03672 [Lasallia pustulata]|uniref:Uncharacterized protein n=1 Tax=Lasallia pustulata TaxID=136370 RepID=A0A5M8PSX1_9LECA|nr:MAG: hypothetical protein FRX48_03672 [Lasallia pustulata]